MADIARDFGSADYLIVGVSNRGHGERDVDQRPVLAQSHGLIVFNVLTCAQPGNYCRLLVNVIVRNQDRHRLADHFAGRITEHALGSPIPAGDDSLKGFGDDRVVR